MKYLVVQVINSAIEIIERVEGDDALKRAKRLAGVKNRQYWKVEDFEAMEQQILRHNTVLGKLATKVQAKKVVPGLRSFEVWDWNKASERDRANLLAWYQAKKWSDIMVLHNDLQLTAETYCCGSFIPKIEANIQKAITDGILGL